MDTVNKEWNIKVDFITFYKFSVTETPSEEEKSIPEKTDTDEKHDK